MPDFDQN